MTDWLNTHARNHLRWLLIMHYFIWYTTYFVKFGLHFLMRIYSYIRGNNMVILKIKGIKKVARKQAHLYMFLGKAMLTEYQVICGEIVLQLDSCCITIASPY